MSKAVYIHGIPDKNISSKGQFIKPIDYSVLTDGELSVLLAARQLDLFYFSTGNKKLKQDSDYLRSIVDFTVNGIEIKTDNQLRKWAEARLKKGDFPAISAAYQSVNGPISYGDYRKKELDKCEQIKKQWENTSKLSFRKRSELRNSWQSCFEAARYINTVNEKLENSGAHLLFSFAVGRTTQSIQVKKVLHNIAIENFSQIFGISNDNIQMWIRNGILAQNINRGFGDKQPEETIKYLIENVTTAYPELTSVGILPAIIAAIKVAFEIITIALAAIQAIMAALKPNDYLRIQSNAQGLGTMSFGPQKDDFLTELSTGVIDSGAIFAVLAAAGILLIK